MNSTEVVHEHITCNILLLCKILKSTYRIFEAIVLIIVVGRYAVGKKKKKQKKRDDSFEYYVFYFKNWYVRTRPVVILGLVG